MVVRLVVVFGGYSLNFVRNTEYVEISMEQLVIIFLAISSLYVGPGKEKELQPWIGRVFAPPWRR